MMTTERLLFVIDCAAMHFGDGAAKAALRMLSYELRNEIKREQAHAEFNTLPNREDTQTSTGTTGT